MTRVAAVRRADAHRRAQRVRDNVMAVNELLETLDEIHEQQDWMALGYKSWADYYEGEFGGLKLSAEQRGRVVAVMAAAGVSKRRIGKALGISDSTVRLDVKGARNRALPSAEPQVKNSGDAPSPPVGVPGQTAAEAFSDISATADDGEGHAFQPADPSAGDGLARDEPVPGNPLDPPAEPPASDMPVEVPVAIDQPGSSSPLARGETGPLAPVAAEEDSRLRNASSAAQDLTDGQTRSLPGTVLPPDVSGVAASGGPAGEEPEAGTEGFSSADLMDAVDALWTALDRLDYDATGPFLLDEELTRIEQLPAVLANAVNLLRQRRRS